MVDTVVQPLFVFPELQRYAVKQRGDFETALRKQAVSGSRVQLSDPRDLELQPNGVTRRWSFRFTWPAFVKVSSLLCRGLAATVADLAGIRLISTNKTTQAPLFDATEAVTVFNRALYLRFDQIATNNVLLDRHQRVIDGIFSPQHQLLTNWSSYNLLAERLQHADAQCAFYAGRMQGRRMQVWFRDTQPLFSFPYNGTNWQAWYGYFMANAETANGAVGVEPVLYTPAGVCRLPIPGLGVTRVRHAGRKFQQSLDSMLESAVAWGRDVTGWRERMFALSQQPLCSADYVFDRSAMTRDTDWLRSAMKVPAVVARAAISRAVVRRDVKDGGLDLSEMGSVTPHGRTRLDFYCGLCETARRCAPTHRARLENFAGKILLAETWPPLFS